MGPRHAHHFGPGRLVALQAKALAQGVAARPQLFREMLVDDGHPGGIARVGLGKRAALHDGHVEGLEVVLVHGVAERGECLLILGPRASKDLVADHLLTAARGNGQGEGGRASAGQLARPFHELAVETPRLLVGVAKHGGIEAGDEHVVTPEARLGAEDVAEPAEEGGGSTEEDEGQRDLGHHEALSPPQPFGEAVGRVPRLERGHEVGASGLERGYQAEGQHAQTRGEQAEEKDAAVELDVEGDELGGQGNSLEELHPRPGQSETQAPTQDGQDQAFGQELAD